MSTDNDPHISDALMIKYATECLMPVDELIVACHLEGCLKCGGLLKQTYAYLRTRPLDERFPYYAPRNADHAKMSP